MSKRVIFSPIKGESMTISKVSDFTFREGILGEGIAINPTDNILYSPNDGEITSVFDTLHAFTMRTNDGIDLLIHLGIDTVKMKGTGFKNIGQIEQGRVVKEGDELISFDLELIEQEGLEPTVLVIVTNFQDYTLFEPEFKELEVGDTLITLD